MRQVTPCELLREILTYVMRDEARHVAFGGVYVGKTIGAMHESEREDVAQFAFEALVMSHNARLRRATEFDPGFLQVVEAADVDPNDLAKGYMEARALGIRFVPPSDQVHAFKHLMMPALFRVGAITPRTRELLEKEGIKLNEDLSILEAMEDSLEMR